MVIHYTSHFVKTFKKLPRTIQMLAIKQEGIFKKDPSDPRLHAKELKGRLKNLMSFRITRNYRLLYAWQDREIVVFYEIGDRKAIYR